MEEWGTDFTPKEPKRLFKSRTDKRLFGVCGGLAKYLECDPTIIRLGVVFLTFVCGSGLLAYLVAAVVMPFEDEVKNS